MGQTVILKSVEWRRRKSRWNKFLASCSGEVSKGGRLETSLKTAATWFGNLLYAEYTRRGRGYFVIPTLLWARYDHAPTRLASNRAFIAQFGSLKNPA